eukprot:2804878-Heterocapsa_arctica.AAC.1
MLGLVLSNLDSGLSKQGCREQEVVMQFNYNYYYFYYYYDYWKDWKGKFGRNKPPQHTDINVD